MNYYIFYNQSKGMFHFDEYPQPGSAEVRLNDQPMPEPLLNEFEVMANIMFDFENQPENPWGYKRKYAFNPSAKYMQDAFNRFLRHKEYLQKYAKP